MKIYLFITLILLFEGAGVQAQETTVDDTQDIPESIALVITANNKLSDQEVLSYLKKLYKYMPQEWQKLQNQAPEKKRQTLQNFRDFHSYNGIDIAEFEKVFKESPATQEMMAQIWAEDTLGVEYAESVLLSLSKKQYLTIIKTAQELILENQTKELPTLTENFPDALNFIEIKQIRVDENYCEIYLYKGIGSMKSIGFEVKQNSEGNWQLSYFNYLQSYDSIPIDLDLNE